MSNEKIVCLWVSSTEPRVVKGRHLADCEASGCPGCMPCHEPHCASCGKEHAPVTCVACLKDARDSLGAIVTMCSPRRLMAEAIVKGVASSAAMLAGPVANPEAFGYRRTTAQATCNHQNLNDRDECIDCIAWLEEAGSEFHPLFVLGTWQTIWCDLLGAPVDPDEHITVGSAATWLDDRMHDFASMADADFAMFRSDLNVCRSYVERILHDGEQVELGAPCLACKERGVEKPQRLVRDRDDKDVSGAGDKWRCSKCKTWWSEADYRMRVGAKYVEHADRLTASQMLKAHRIKPGSLTGWASKDLVKKRGKDDSGRVLYDVADALKMRDRAGESLDESA